MKKYSLIIFLFLTSIFYGQNNRFGVGPQFGVGSIRGNLPSQTVLNVGMLIELPSIFTDFYSFQISFNYLQKAERFLPEDRKGRYYPFIKCFSLKPIIRQLYSNNFYTEEGLGFLYLNDRTFSDVDSWNYGISLHLLGGIILNPLSKHSVNLGMKFDYGITFNNTTASYFVVQIQSIFNFNL